jgi:hypothetical protein
MTYGQCPRDKLKAGMVPKPLFIRPSKVLVVAVVVSARRMAQPANETPASHLPHQANQIVYHVAGPPITH